MGIILFRFSPFIWHMASSKNLPARLLKCWDVRHGPRLCQIFLAIFLWFWILAPPETKISHSTPFLLCISSSLQLSFSEASAAHRLNYLYSAYFANCLQERQCTYNCQNRKFCNCFTFELILFRKLWNSHRTDSSYAGKRWPKRRSLFRQAQG